MLNIYQRIAILYGLSVAFAFINHRFIQVQSTIAIMISALLVSSVALVAHHFYGLSFLDHLLIWFTGVDFKSVLMHGMLGYLLFAGALHIDLNSLKSQSASITTLATLGTLLSTLLVGFGLFWIAGMIGTHLRIIDCLLFGAIISPTDPIAVLATLKQLNCKASWQTIMAGESLFNDGIGIVIFTTLSQLAYATTPISYTQTLLFFMKTAVLGTSLGLLMGYFIFRILKQTHCPHLEIMLTIALVTTGYTIAESLGLSGPLAMVAAGIMIGNKGRQFALDTQSTQRLDDFWGLLDEILNTILFFMLGLSLMLITWHRLYAAMMIGAIIITLLARYICVSFSMRLVRIRTPQCSDIPNVLLTWGGLRGGLAVALALSLPQSHAANLILSMTYAVVVFSVVIQGLTIHKLIKGR